MRITMNGYFPFSKNDILFQGNSKYNALKRCYLKYYDV